MRPRRPRIAEIVLVRWDIAASRDAVPGAAVERVLLPAAASGLVGQWDDGRGRWPWYEARRGRAERRLRAAMTAACGTEPSTVTVNATAPGRVATARPTGLE